MKKLRVPISASFLLVRIVDGFVISWVCDCASVGQPRRKGSHGITGGQRQRTALKLRKIIHLLCIYSVGVIVMLLKT